MTAAAPDARRARRRRFALAAAVASLLAAAVVGEVLVRALGLTSSPRRHFRPGIYAPDAELGWALRPDYRGVHVEYTFEAPTTTNGQGWRGPAWDAARAAAPRRVLCLGDSCTFGRGVDDASTWPARLEARLGAGSAVFNAGVPGFDTVQELAALERLLPVVRPTHVVVAWLPNDVVERSVDTRPSDAPEPPEKARLRQKIIDGHLVTAGNVEEYEAWKDSIEGRGLNRSALYRLLRVRTKLLKESLGLKRGSAPAGGEAARIVHQLDYSQRPLAAILGRCRELGIRAVVLLVPRQEELEEPAADVEHHVKMATFARGLGATVVDLQARWRSPPTSRASWFLPRDAVHFTPAGYDEVAAAVAEALPGP